MPRQRERSLSTHVLDTELGQPARGVRVSLARWQDGALKPLGQAATDQDGRIEELDGGDFAPGVYQLTFHLDSYRGAGGPRALFFRTVTLEIEVADTTRHYHVPLLLAPYACTTYRGS